MFSGISSLRVLIDIICGFLRAEMVRKGISVSPSTVKPAEDSFDEIAAAQGVLGRFPACEVMPILKWAQKKGVASLRS